METSWYAKKLSDIFQNFSVDPETGLGPIEVEKQKELFGLNTLPEGKKKRWWMFLFEQFKSPLVFILLIAALLTFIIHEYIDLTVILLAVFVNVFIGFWQEYRSNTIFEKLHHLVKVTARVKRNSKLIEVDMSALVPGDIIFLRGDSKVPADARIIRAHNLLVNEAILTGESQAVEKINTELSGERGAGDRSNMIHMGTLIERGEGEAIVVSTGEDTEIGKIAELTAITEDEATPLQERLSKLGRILALFMSGAALIIFVTGFFEGRSLVEMFTVAVAVAVAAIPEGLPAALSVVLAVAASRILKKKGLVKNLIGAETLGSTSVVVADKTGTMTEGNMVVEHLFASQNHELASLALALSSDVVVLDSGVQGESTDRAKVEFFTKNGNSLTDALKQYPRKILLPFDQDTKIISSFHSDGGSIRLFASGAPEVLLARSTKSEIEQNVILEEVDEYARKGYRLIGVAERHIQTNSFDPENEDALKNEYHDFTILGVVAIRDPIRADVFASIKETREAGVRVLMATGDHKLTALAIGRELGFRDNEDAVITGNEIDALSEEAFKKKLETVEIFSRVSPAHKKRIVDALKDGGAVVAMTGDGINDAPALRAADIGVSLESGTDVTKETADLVLLNDSFSIITAAIRQGRIAFDNIRKVAVFLLSNSFTEIIIVLAGLVFRTEFLPITAVQILWANLVEDSFPNFALAFEPGEKDIMKRKPIPRGERILDKEGRAIIFIVGILADLMLVGIFLYLYYYSTLTPEHIQTLIFALLAVNSLFIVFAIKSYHASIFHTHTFDNYYLIFAVCMGFVLMGAAIYAPLFQKFLGTVSLTFMEVLFVLGMGMLQMFLIEIVKWWFRRTGVLRVAKHRTA